MNEFIHLDWPRQYVARLEIDRPDRRNALNRAVIRESHEHLDRLEDRELRALIITGRGASFCAGADLRQIRAFSPQEGRRFAYLGHRLFQRIEEYPAPVIAAVNGFALGGGCELACACDLRYAAAAAQFGQPESRVGMIPGWGGTFRLPRLIGTAQAKELIFTSQIIDSERALALGLVNRVYPDDQLDERVLEMAETIASNAPIANREAKRLVNRCASDRQKMINEDGLALAYCMATEDQTEAIDAFLEKREPSFNNR